MNLQLHHVVSDITGATGMKIIRSIIAGERSAKKLASYRDVRCKKSEQTISDVLTGNYRPEHVFALKQAVSLYDFYQGQIAECDKEIEAMLSKLKTEKPAPNQTLPKARHRTKQKNEPDFALRQSLYMLVEVDLTKKTESVHTRPCVLLPNATTIWANGRH